MSFAVIPAVDLLGNVAVRLQRGRFDRIVASESDPEALVARFAAAGARMLHVVDLDGARSGRTRPELIRALVQAAAPVPVQASGGARTPRAADELIEAGADRVVIGTGAFSAPGSLERLRSALDGRLVVAIDVRDGYVATRAWTELSALSPEVAAERCAAAGVARILCTAIDRDGTLTGPDLGLLARVRERSGLDVLAAGGIRSPDDLDALESIGCEGAVVGRALLDGRLPLSILQRP
jgi:phosphoribosylformimino-5-aminoimidazole carboxamide ribotide isomerase